MPGFKTKFTFSENHPDSLEGLLQARKFVEAAHHIVKHQTTGDDRGLELSKLIEKLPAETKKPFVDLALDTAKT